ncbi:DnaD domain-containing protein [Bacillus sp. REN16]|uniref:DnaD domain-containing protein n=1 Tax=Bacillus sp. REN16 TaxID=2887296 RepID=UPI001E424F4E|nr:DnaD domain protein [Bacillus sp. REN16]MCC3359122.1 DnaD domain protein [Bacillus sp. REN16]
MARYRMVRTDFWMNPVVSEEMTPEDKYFFLYLLTNPHTTQIGIYRITKKQMAFDMGYSIETVHSLMDRFIHHHKIIQYNPKTRELAIKNWGKYNLHKGGKPIMDCIFSELKEVEDPSLIEYVADKIDRQDILSLYESFYKNHSDEDTVPAFYHYDEVIAQSGTTDNLPNDTSTTCSAIRGQKEKQKEKEKQKQQVHYPSIDNESKTEAIREIMECWDQNGFGLNNVNAKEKLVAWLDDASFLNPKDVILKAMDIACANNKRRLNYVVGILKNWENESLLTVEEIELYNESKRQVQAVEPKKSGRAIPGHYHFDPTAGEN